jgi:hypothetical protein
VIIDLEIGLMILTQVRTRLLETNFFRFNLLGENWIGSMERLEFGSPTVIIKTLN